jgi:hypothetical protein
LAEDAAASWYRDLLDATRFGFRTWRATQGLIVVGGGVEQGMSSFCEQNGGTFALPFAFGGRCSRGDKIWKNVFPISFLGFLGKQVLS